MSYLAAWFLLSLIGCAVCFFITHDTDNDDEHETIQKDDGRCLWPVHGQRAAPDAVEENDACPRSLSATFARGE